MKLIDTHAHVNFVAFKEDSREVIKKSLKKGVWIINVGSQFSTSKRAVKLAEEFQEGVFAAIGLHPIHLETGLVKIKEDPEEIQFQTIEEDFDYQKYKELAQSRKVVAIGEIGLDYYWKPKTKRKFNLFKEKQKKVLCDQLKLAKEFNLPVIFHCRDAYEDLIEFLSKHPCASQFKPEGVIHCFVGGWDIAQKFLEMGFYLGFNGIIFRKNLKEVIEKVPQEKILLETDCPYLTPPQAEGRNEPLNIKYVAEEIAKIKKTSFEKICEVTTQNAKRLFKI